MSTNYNAIEHAEHKAFSGKESSPDHQGKEQATEALRQQALKLYQCKDGSLAPDPAQCRDMNQFLPKLDVVDGDKAAQVAGKTTRDNESGEKTDERDATHSRRFSTNDSSTNPNSPKGPEEISVGGKIYREDGNGTNVISVAGKTYRDDRA